MSDALDEYAREKRLATKRPSNIRHRNKGKRTGLLSFEVSEDGKTVTVWNYRALRGAEKIAIAVIAQTKGKLFDTQSGGALAEFVVGNPKEAVKLLKLTPVPEECARCEGCGQIKNPRPAPNLPYTREANESIAEFEARIKKASDDYCATHNVPNTNYRSIITCPSCRGTGCAVQLDSEET